MTPSLELLTEHLQTTLAALGVVVADTQARHGTPDPGTELAAQMTLESDAQTASVILATDVRTAIALVRAIAGTDVGADDPLLGDTMGEILNVVAGAARRRAQFTFGIPLTARDQRQISRQWSGKTFESRRCLINGGAVDLFLASDRTSPR